ncbi:hypothetical protein [Geminicoccus harenae]|nr:hypothetical protein [Geminicoccus harenae]
MSSLGDAIVYGLGMATIFLGAGCLGLLLGSWIIAAIDRREQADD